MNYPNFNTDPFIGMPQMPGMQQPTIPFPQPSIPQQPTPTLPSQFPVIEQSYIENILRLNRGKMATVYMNFENSQWGSKVFKGIIEAAGKDHIILSDPQTGIRYLLLMIYLNYITFDEEINYEYPFAFPQRPLTQTAAPIFNMPNMQYAPEYQTQFRKKDCGEPK